MTHEQWVNDLAAQLHAIYDGVGDLTEAQIDRTDPLIKGAHEDYVSRVGTPVPMGAVGEAYGRWWRMNAIRSAEVLHGYTTQAAPGQPIPKDMEPEEPTPAKKEVQS